MARRQFTGPRIPRKDKVWATRNSGASDDLVVPNVVQLNGLEIQADLLSAFKTDVGVNTLQKVTCMRIVGSIGLGNLVTESVSRNSALAWGIAWVTASITGAAINDPQIPDPNAGGDRQAEWLQRGKLFLRTTAGLPLVVQAGETTSRMSVDITQMRKQPTVNHQLVLITRHQSDGGGISAPSLLFNFHTMLALP